MKQRTCRLTLLPSERKYERLIRSGLLQHASLLLLIYNSHQEQPGVIVQWAAHSHA
ncbi:hypothetical protein D3C78_1978380 [compost metagenome]